jgi:hypothetical protein
MTASASLSDGKNLREPMTTTVDLDQKAETTSNLAKDMLSPASPAQARLVDLKLPIRIAKGE